MAEDVCTFLHDLAFRALGPCGTLHCVASALPHVLKGSAEVCDDLARLAPKASPLRSPVARLLLQLVQTHVAQYGDGGHQLLLLCTGLALQIARCLGAVPLPTVEWAFQMATEWAVAFIASPANATRVPLDCSVTEHLLCVVDAVLGTSPLLSPVPEERWYLSSQLLLLFLHIYAPDPGGPAPSLRFQQCLQDDLGTTPRAHPRLLDGILIDWALPLEATAWAPPPDGQPSRVLLFDVCLEPSAGSQAVATVAPARSASAAEWCRTFLAEVARLEVAAVLCQKTIHPRLRLQLLRAGVLALPRLSLRHVAAVRELTGCAVLSDVHVPADGHGVGQLTAVGELTLAGKRFIHLKNDARPMFTLLLVGETQAALDAQERAAGRVLRVLRGVVAAADAPGGAVGLLGAGAFEHHLAQHLRAKLETLPARIPNAAVRAQVTLAIQAYISCVELPIRALVVSGGTADATGAMLQLEAANACLDYYRSCVAATAVPAPPDVCYGWDPAGQRLRPQRPDGAGPAAVVDSAAAKGALLRAAVDTALLLARVDSHLITLDR